MGNAWALGTGWRVGYVAIVTANLKSLITGTAAGGLLGVEAIVRQYHQDKL